MKGQRSATSQIAATKKGEFYSLVKYVLHLSRDRRLTDGRPVISRAALFDHIYIVIQDYYHLLCNEYSYLLVNYFLTRSVWTDWREPDIHRLVSKYLMLYSVLLTYYALRLSGSNVSLNFECFIVICYNSGLKGL